MPCLAVVLALFLIWSPSADAAVDMDKVSRSIVKTGSQLVRGNPKTAVYSAIPNMKYQKAYTNVGINQNRIYLIQNIPKLNRIGGKYLGLSANVNAASQLRYRQVPTFKPQAQVNANTKYFSNTTTFRKNR